jgi:hypothetical protein
MQKFEDLGPGAIKVVTGYEVENLTRQGWKLVFCYQDAMLMPCQETAPRGFLNPTNTYAPDTVEVRTSRPYSVTYFVLRQDEESALAQAQVSFEAERARADAAVEAEKALFEKTKEAIKALALEKDRIKTLELTNKSLGSERDALRDTNKRMETDLAKLRKAIGELQFKEITS